MLKFQFFCCLLIAVCSTTFGYQYFRPDPSKIEKWKERTTKSWCKAKWSTSLDYQIKAMVHTGGPHRLLPNDEIKYRICAKDRTGCDNRDFWWTDIHRIHESQDSVVLSRIHIPPERVNCSDCVLEWRIITANGRHTHWRPCMKSHRRSKRDVLEVTLSPPDIDWDINSAELELESTMAIPQPTQPFTSKSCKAVRIWTTVQGMDTWCTQNCNAGYCPADRCVCKRSTPRPATAGASCRSVAPYDKVPGMDDWCVVNCRADYCPSSHCSCEKAGYTKSRPNCKAKGVWKFVPGMDEWCIVKCEWKICAKDRCKCE